ncbi:hypothetical protein Tco_0004215 [Tanacetum coccineum]
MGCSGGKSLLACGYGGGERLQGEYSCEDDSVDDLRLLLKDMHNTNFDQLFAHLRKHEFHANEIRLMKQRYPDPIALVANSYDLSPSYTNQTQYYPYHSSISHQYYSPPTPTQHSIDVPIVQQRSYQPPVANDPQVVHHQIYQAPAINQSSPAPFPQLEFGLAVPSFLPLNDPIATTIQDGRVQVQTVQGRQNQELTNTGGRSNASRMNKNGGTMAAQASQEIPSPAIFQTDDLDAFDSDYDDQENKIIHETLTDELERYKEQVKLFEERQKFDLNDREKYIDGQLRQVIVDRNAKVFSTWMAFGGNTRNLSSFGEETEEITDLDQILEEVLLTERGDGVAGIKRCRRDPSSDGVRDLVTASRCSRLNEDLESST